MMPTKERLILLKLKNFIRMGQNSFMNQFMNELQKLNIDGSIIKEIEEQTINIPSINELSLFDKCEIRIHELEDEHDHNKTTSKTSQLLKIIYDLNDRIEMKNKNEVEY
jgi:hypothetical protein